MSWIKRNLYFFIGSVIAVLLMGLGGWYLYSKWQLNNQLLGKLNDEYTQLAGFANQNPHPGNAKVDNIKLAKEQQQQLRDFIQNARKYFVRIPQIPDVPKVTPPEFSSALSRTIDQLQRDATNASVALQPKYQFSFEAQNKRVSFDPASLEPLSVQLGEVRAICDVLFAAKINWLDFIRRERVSKDDSSGPLTDYLEHKSVTNQLAVISPYEITFRCFTPELALVLSGFASSANAMIIKTINVEPAPATQPTEQPTQPVVTYQPEPVQQPQLQPSPEASMEAFRRRYGLGPKAAAPPPPQVQYAAPAPAPNRGGLPTVLDEKLLKVTMVLDIIKLIPPK
jgi:hypothetical protein